MPDLSAHNSGNRIQVSAFQNLISSSWIQSTSESYSPHSFESASSLTRIESLFPLEAMHSICS